MNQVKSSSQLLLRKGAEMVVWQGTARIAAFAASIWAARCLGPANLGISAMMLASVTQVSLLVHLNQNNLLIRRFRNTSNVDERNALINLSTSFRFFSVILLSLTILFGILFIPHESVWTLPLLAGLPLLICEANQPAWLLQARDSAPVIQRTALLQSLLVIAGYIFFLRPGATAGTDLIITGTAASAAALVGWRSALQGIPIYLRLKSIGAYFKTLKEGKWLILSGISNYLYNSAFVALVGYLVSVPDAGIFRVANGLGMQLTIITTVGQQLLFPRFIDLARTNPAACRRLQHKIVTIVLLAGIPSVALCYFFAPFAISKLYSTAYQAAATPFTLIIATRFFAASASVYAFGLWAQGRDRRMAVITTILAIPIVAISFFLIPYLGINGAALTGLVGEVASLIVTYSLSRPNKQTDQKVELVPIGNG